MDALDITTRLTPSRNLHQRMRLLNGVNPGSARFTLVIVALLRTGRKWGNPEPVERS
jgi:hypothetical protein